MTPASKEQPVARTNSRKPSWSCSLWEPLCLVVMEWLTCQSYLQSTSMIHVRLLGSTKSEKSSTSTSQKMPPLCHHMMETNHIVMRTVLCWLPCISSCMCRVVSLYDCLWATIQPLPACMMPGCRPYVCMMHACLHHPCMGDDTSSTTCCSRS